MSYEYVIATVSDRELVREALANYFYPEEPLTLAHRDGPDVTMDDMENALSFLAQGTIILARTLATRKLVGVAIGGLSTDVIKVPITTRNTSCLPRQFNRSSIDGATDRIGAYPLANSSNRHGGSNECRFSATYATDWYA
ncbi:uncharacterized protein LOC125766868 [Anopheles funestus]|uniref:uncharacterized protein LOC125766868 n=1 Tax=Anopheles funestus TaxID=62324 RepID=UPI0020C67EAD|nr:uncharacterized protein LOC125766868 [Anopheles funestus]